MQDNPVNWFENLPLVMLSIRTSFKEELECSPSDLVYGQSLRLPQEFSSATLANNLMNRSQLVAKLRDFVENLQPPSPREHHGKFFIDKNLKMIANAFLLGTIICNNHSAPVLVDLMMLSPAMRNILLFPWMVKINLYL